MWCASMRHLRTFAASAKSTFAVAASPTWRAGGGRSLRRNRTTFIMLVADVPWQFPLASLVADSALEPLAYRVVKFDVPWDHPAYIVWTHLEYHHAGQ